MFLRRTQLGAKERISWLGGLLRCLLGGETPPLLSHRHEPYYARRKDPDTSTQPSSITRNLSRIEVHAPKLFLALMFMRIPSCPRMNLVQEETTNVEESSGVQILQLLPIDCVSSGNSSTVIIVITNSATEQCGHLRYLSHSCFYGMLSPRVMLLPAAAKSW